MKRIAKSLFFRGFTLCLFFAVGLTLPVCAFPYVFMDNYLAWETAILLASLLLGELVLLTFVLWARWTTTAPLAEGEKPKLRERVPLDLFCLLATATALFGVILIENIYHSVWGFRYNLGRGYYLTDQGAAVLLTVFFLLFIGYHMLVSIVVRVRRDRLGALRHTVVYRVCHWLRLALRDGAFPSIRAALRWTGHKLLWLGHLASDTAGPRLRALLRLIFREFPVIFLCAVALGAYAVIGGLLFVQVQWGEPWAIILWLMGNLLVFLFISGVCIQLRTLFRAADRMVGGELSPDLETDTLLPVLRAHGKNLVRIGDGLTLAVEERLRSERLKTDLITNVSHDIKTPLTSIVSYVDLLSQEEVGEEAREYLRVLERQSNRLKKLTEDLVEASRAATGNLPVTLAPTGVMEILNQALGEYSDRLDEREIRPVIHAENPDIAVTADGRHLWRVFDNLLGNVCKYAQSGTRVYIDVVAVRGGVEISMKNISATPLNITSDELMERFVRGDTARTTEGSGLGLSIARSLVDIQRGRFSLIIDGDLFKTVIFLPAA